mmetsp:Transcript_84543/g.220038  ORF Transcript_84543/g.220038 Transcript_84543/m.220038 type:complete len:232 (+) Transcript_84543:816-1511(+)
MSEARKLQPLREEWENRPGRGARCALAQDQNKGRVPEERPDLGQVLHEYCEEPLLLSPLGQLLLVRLADLPHDQEADRRAEGCHPEDAEPPAGDAEDVHGRIPGSDLGEDRVHDVPCEEQPAKGGASLRRRISVRDEAHEQRLDDAEAHAVEHAAADHDLEGPGHAANHEAPSPKEHAQADDLGPRQQLANKAGGEGEHSCNNTLDGRQHAQLGLRHFEELLVLMEKCRQQ